MSSVWNGRDTLVDVETLTAVAEPHDLGIVASMSTHPLAFELTDTNRTWLVEIPIRIAIYIVVALVIRFILHRIINRATRTPFGLGERGHAALIRLRDRSPAAIRDPDAVERRKQRAETIGSVLKSAVSVIVLIWLLLSLLSVLKVNIAPFLASAGILGLAIGFGAQNLVRDFVSGVFMLLEDQYGVGDVIDVGEVTGTVETVGLRITTLRDLDGTLWYVRNGEITRVGNMSQEYAVARVEIPLAHSANIELAQQIALDAAHAAVTGPPRLEAVLDDPQMLGVQAVSATTVTLRLTVKTKANAQWAVAREIRKHILNAYAENGIDRPVVSGTIGAPPEQ